jgi:natural product precursor
MEKRMQQKKFKKKLTLKKETISNLAAAEMNNAKGGGASEYESCNTWTCDLSLRIPTNCHITCPEITLP